MTLMPFRGPKKRQTRSDRGMHRLVTMPPVASLQLPPDHTAAAKARRFVSHTLQDWGLKGNPVADAELMVSELVTNVVLHLRARATVSVERCDGHVRVAVADPSTTLPALRNYEPDAVTGRGLLLVDRIADRWGVEQNRRGKSVWFEVRVDERDDGAA